MAFKGVKMRVFSWSSISTNNTRFPPYVHPNLESTKGPLAYIYLPNTYVYRTYVGNWLIMVRVIVRVIVRVKVVVKVVVSG